MIKIALSGKINTGKNTAARLIIKNFNSAGKNTYSYKIIAFADPIKEIVKTMFPYLPKKYLYGSSKFRDQIIEGAKDIDGNPLTVRRSLLDIGTKLGRGYKDSLWLDVFWHRIMDIKHKTDIVLVSDLRFRNEFDFLKEKGFYTIRIERNNNNVLNHTSETDQNKIKNEEFDFILDNNGSLEELNSAICSIVNSIKNKL